MTQIKGSDLVIALLQVKTEPWKSIYETGQLQTWIEDSPNSVQIINVYGQTPTKLMRKIDFTHEKLRWQSSTGKLIYIFDWFVSYILRKINNPRWEIKKHKEVINLTVNFPSTNLTLPNIEIALFRYFLKNTKAKFLYMSNTSSYINIYKLIKEIEKFSQIKVYGGTIQKYLDLEFVSGSNRILSRDLVEFIVDNFNKWQFQYLDDVAMSKMLKNLNTNKVEVSSISFTSIKEINNMNPAELKKFAHFRLKSGNLKNRIDADLMHCLHEKLNNS